jgi:Tfp pilus assembly protein PilN
MIRINLLGERKRQIITLKAPSGPPKTTFLLLLFLIAFVAAGAFLYSRYRSLNGQLETLRNETAVAQRDKQRRQQLLNEIEEFKKRQRSLEGRIAVIEELKRSQMGPIRWLNALGGAVDKTQSVWLTSVGQAGDHMTIEGVATSLNGVADFATTLKGTGFFDNVSINESEQTTVTGLEGYTFSISCDMKTQTPSTKS